MIAALLVGVLTIMILQSVPDSCFAWLALLVLWGVFAAYLGWRWGTLALAGSFIAVIVAIILIAWWWRLRQEKRRAAWVASGEAEQRFAYVQRFLGALASELAFQCPSASAPPLPGAALCKSYAAKNAEIVADGTRGMPLAIRNLEKCLLGVPSRAKVEAVCIRLRDGILPMLHERDALRSLRLRPEDGEGQRLWIALYDGLLKQASDWAAFAQDRVRAAHQDLAVGKSMYLKLEMEFAPPPEAQALQAWLSARGWVWENIEARAREARATTHNPRRA